MPELTSINKMSHFGHVGAPLPMGALSCVTVSFFLAGDSSRTMMTRAGAFTREGFSSPGPRSSAKSFSRNLRDIDGPPLRFRSLLDELRQVRRRCQKVFVFIFLRLFDELHDVAEQKFFDPVRVGERLFLHHSEGDFGASSYLQVKTIRRSAFNS